jgi:RimJ/RimL family protein N-acetyltransferase
MFVEDMTMETAAITTERLVLRRLTMDDLPLMIRLNTNREVFRFLDTTLPTPGEIEAELRQSLEEYAHSFAPGRLAAFLRADDAFVGRFSLHPFGGESELSVGYRLMPEFWGAGLATEGTRALIDVGFGMPDIDVVRAQTMFVNAGSRGVMAKSGMHYVRTFHEEFDDPLPGTELGEVEYAITKQEWLASRPV